MHLYIRLRTKLLLDMTQMKNLFVKIGSDVPNVCRRRNGEFLLLVSEKK